MKYLFASVFTVIIIGLFAFKGKEGVKSQSEELKNMQLGDYTVYLTHKKEDGSYMGGMPSYTYKLVSFEPDKVFPEQNYDVKTELTWNDNGNIEKHLYLASNFGFSATYQADSYEGNKEFRDVYGYVPRSFVDGSVSEHRMVFLDGRMYIIEDWKNKDDYTLVAVAEFGEAPKGFKLVKAVFKTPKKMKELDPDKKLKNYLDAAYPQQEKSKSPPQVIAKLEKLKADWKNFLKKDREDYLNSPEYQAYKNALNDNSPTKVTIKNTGGKSVCVSHSGGTQSISAGGTASFSCDKDIYYGVDNGSGCRSSKSRLIVGANQSCGKTISVQ